MADRTLTLSVSRYRPEHRPAPYVDRFEIPYREDMVVLDALNYVKDELDGSLAYRWSCRMGVCGSCGMMVNYKPRLTCSTFLREFYPKPILVEPLEGFPVVRDLMVDMTGFMEKLRTVKPWIIRDTEASIESGEYLQSPDQVDRFKQFSMCINCMLCYAACPVVGKDPEFLGPAVLALAHRYNQDSRDEGWQERHQSIAVDWGLWDCTFIGECSVVCPKGVDPAAAIQREKVAKTTDAMLSLMLPFGGRG
jgi:fumarate reductase iron-sulfur subunit